MNITIKKIKAAKGTLINDDEQTPSGVTPEDSPVRHAAMGQSGTDIRQIAG